MSKFYRSCECKEWKDNCDILDSALILALTHGGEGLKKSFFYCPWCGELLKEDVKSEVSE